MEIARINYTNENGLSFVIRVNVTSGERSGFIAFVDAEDMGAVSIPFRVHSTPAMAELHARKSIGKLFA